MDTLSNLLPPTVPPGFRLLVRYIDQLAASHKVAVCPIALVSQLNVHMDLTDAVAVVQTRKSIVLRQSPESNSIIKIGPSQLVRREAQIHAVVDDGPNVRAMVSSGSVRGLEEKDQEPLMSYVELQGFGEPLSENHFPELSKYWKHAAAALTYLHSRAVLHRDIKPSNMIIIDGSLTLNDFDCSCFAYEEQIRRAVAGTPQFRNPFLVAGESFAKADDWNSLVLSFLSLRMDITYKAEALRQALELEWVPDDMKAAITIPDD